MWNIICNHKIISSPTLLAIIPLVLFAYRRRKPSGTLRYVFSFAVINFVFQWIMLYLAGNGTNNLIVANAFIVVRYALVASMFYSVFQDKLSMSAVKVLSCIFLVVVTLDWIHVGIDRSFMYAGLAECVFASSFCFLFYRELLLFLPVRYLLDYSFFYICSGFLVFYLGNLYLTPLSYYLDVPVYNVHMEFFIMMPYFLESVLTIILSFGIVARES
jgi:hypothetical protein